MLLNIQSISIPGVPKKTAPSIYQFTVVRAVFFCDCAMTFIDSGILRRYVYFLDSKQFPN